MQAHSPASQPYSTFSLGGETYVQRSTNHSLNASFRSTNCLVSIVEVKPGDRLNRPFLEEVISRYLRDDVFRQEFLAGIIFRGANRSEVVIDLGSNKLRTTWGIHWYFFAEEAELPRQLPPGPYSLHKRRLHFVRRVYSDDNYGFVRATWHHYRSPEDFLELRVSGEKYRSVGVAVPSRLHACPSETTPLDGVRIAVKDIFDLCGLRTSIGSLPYYQLYPPSLQTAEAVARLISMGADVVGKLAMSAFALQEHPMQSVDYQAPVNPRGDGYQIPGGSSSGGGAAIASYEWLDLALVTDTTGSARIPALYNGCFGLRPSSGLIPMSNCKSVYPEFDTPGLMGRDLSLFHRVLQSWCHSEPPKDGLSGPFRVIYPRDFRSVASVDQLTLLDSFASNLASVLSTQVEKISMAEDWAASPPEQSESPDEFLHNMNEHGFFYSAYRSFESFRLDYAQKYGTPPFITEMIRWVWEFGKEVQPHQNQEALRRIKVFRNWFLEKYMSTPTENVLFVLPLTEVNPNYRDIYPGIPTAPSTGLAATSLGPAIGAPELTVPIGETQYFSRITKRNEKLPVMAALMGMPGTDMELVQVALHSLKKLALPTKVHVGKSMFGEYADGPGNE